MFKEEIKMIVTNLSFYIAILVTALICLSGTIYIDLDTGEEFNVFQIMFKGSKSVNVDPVIMNDSKAVLEGTASYLNMFAPMIVAIPFVILVCGEKKNSLSKFELLRVNKNRYTLGKLFAVLIAGGCIMVSGYGLYVLVSNCVLPAAEQDMSMEFQMMTLNRISTAAYHSLGINGLYLIKFVCMFLYGSVSTMLAFAISSFLKNRYLVLCIPFIMHYFFSMIQESITKVSIPGLSDISEIYRFDDEKSRKIVILIVTEIVLSAVLYRIVLDRKCDCSE